MKHRPILLWFRNDLRLTDNRALAYAAKLGAPIIPVFVLDDETPGDWSMGAARRWWLHQSLDALGRDLVERGASLVLRRGPALGVVSELAAQTNASSVVCSRAYEPWAAALETKLKAKLEAQDVEFKRFSGALLFEPEVPRTKSGDPFKVYSPFWRAVNAGEGPNQPLPAPKVLTGYHARVASEPLLSFELEPSKPNWAQDFRQSWSPGEAGAADKLATFLKTALKTYDEDRNRPDKPGTSRLSPHLAHGEISPAMCWHAASAYAHGHPGHAKGLEVFLKELAWREFSYHLLAHNPELPKVNFRREFDHFPWAPDNIHTKSALKAWQRGRTGYPIVDAGMRELWQTGYMHNRVRMIVASFLIKDLLIDWRQGEAWFWDTLLDSDLASNSASWQWVAGSGADAAPYFRVFNPATQGAKFDPDGGYVRKFVPELAACPTRYIHAPWQAPELELRAAGIRLGTTYPRPIVDHGDARERALKAFERIKLIKSEVP